MNLEQIFPTAEVMLALEPEELGGALLEMLAGSAGQFSQGTFTGPILRQPRADWPREKFRQIEYAVAEAFAWLECAELIMEDFTQRPYQEPPGC